MRLPQLSDFPTLEDYYDALDIFLCPKCGGEGLEYGAGPVRMSNGEVHEAPYNCATNGHFLGWKEKPRTKEQAKAKRSRRGKKRKAAPLEAEKCVFCHRTWSELQVLGLELVDAHNNDHADLIDSNLPDDPATHVWFCSECHADSTRRREHEERNRWLREEGLA